MPKYQLSLTQPNSEQNKKLFKVQGYTPSDTHHGYGATTFHFYIFYQTTYSEDGLEPGRLLAEMSIW